MPRLTRAKALEWKKKRRKEKKKFEALKKDVTKDIKRKSRDLARCVVDTERGYEKKK